MIAYVYNVESHIAASTELPALPTPGQWLTVRHRGREVDVIVEALTGETTLFHAGGNVTATKVRVREVNAVAELARELVGIL